MCAQRPRRLETSARLIRTLAAGRANPLQHYRQCNWCQRLTHWCQRLTLQISSASTLFTRASSTLSTLFTRAGSSRLEWHAPTQVALLSSNIIISATDGSVTRAQGGEAFGCRVVVHGASTARLSHVTLQYCGQVGGACVWLCVCVCVCV